jgi:hypothetical protein
MSLNPEWMTEVLVAKELEVDWGYFTFPESGKEGAWM